jgi:hypothetical protein
MLHIIFNIRLDQLPSITPLLVKSKITYLFDSYLQPSIFFVRTHLKELILSVDNNLTASLMRLLGKYLLMYIHSHIYVYILIRIIIELLLMIFFDTWSIINCHINSLLIDHTYFFLTESLMRLLGNYLYLYIRINTYIYVYTYLQHDYLSSINWLYLKYRFD